MKTWSLVMLEGWSLDQSGVLCIVHLFPKDFLNIRGGHLTGSVA